MLKPSANHRIVCHSLTTKGQKIGGRPHLWGQDIPYSRGKSKEGSFPRDPANQNFLAEGICNIHFLTLTARVCSYFPDGFM